MEYTSAVAIRAIVKTVADTREDAIAMVNDYISEYDFGQMEDVDWDVDYTRDEHYDYGED